MEAITLPQRIPEQIIRCLQGENLEHSGLLPLTERAPFFVLYGPPNTGKSTILDLTETWFGEIGVKYIRLKFPIYSLEPTGPKIAQVFGKRQPKITMDPTAFQLLTTRNRHDLQARMINLLNSGVVILAEDFTLTGMGAALFNHADLDAVVAANRGLIVPDKALILTGQRFRKGVEQDHPYENDDARWEASLSLHNKFADQLGYQIVDNRQPIEAITAAVWQGLEPFLKVPES